MRRAHYPAERNHLHAHVTMFHSFAPSLLDELRDFLPMIAREFAPPEAGITGLLKWEKGTAIALRSQPLLNLRALISDHFHGSLSDQDLYDIRPHITIQNKVSKQEAKELQRELAPQIEERNFAFPALELHLYQGGPWELVKRCAFRGREIP